MPCRDPYGYALTTSPEAAAAYSRGLLDVLRLRAGRAARAGRVDRPRPDLRAGHAALALLGHELCASVDVEARLRDAAPARRPRHRARAQPRARRGPPRRRRLAPAGRAPRRPTPCDALLLSTAVPTIAFAGVTEVPEEAWSIVERAAPAYGDDWWFTGLLAFVRQEQGRFDEAMDARVPLAGRRAGRRPLRPRPGPRALRDRRPRGRAGLDGRLGHRRRRLDRQPQPLRLARRAARAVARRPRRRAAPLRRAAAARARPRLPRPRRHRVAAVPLGADARTPRDVPGLGQVAGAGRPRRAGAARDAVPGHALRRHAARPRTTRPGSAGWPRWAAAHAHPTQREVVAPLARALGRAGRRPLLRGRRRAAPPWPARAAGSAARTPSARSSRRPGSRPWSAPAGSTRPAACWTRRLDRRHSPRDRRVARPTCGRRSGQADLVARRR